MEISIWTYLYGNIYMEISMEISMELSIWTYLWKYLYGNIYGNITMEISIQWVDKKGNILTGNQPDFPMISMGFSCNFSLKPIS